MANSGISLSVTARALTRSQFFGKDFDTYKDEIIEFLRLRFGDEIVSNIVASEQGIMLIEMAAYALATMSWYGDRQIDDVYLRDCRVRSAAATIARQLGYKVTGAVPPAVEITMTDVSPTPTTRLILEKGRKLQGPQGLTFEMTEEVIFDVGETGPKTFGARQGETVEESFISNGQPNQVFYLRAIPEGSELAYQLVQAFVGSVEWDESLIMTYEQTDQFEVLYGHSPPRVVFGDGTAGNIPPKDVEIRIRYVTTDGTGGSVPSNTVTTFVEPLVAGLTTYSATLTHDDPSTSGADSEGLASIKANAPLTYQAAGRSVTQDDLDGWINSFVDPTYGAVAIGRANFPTSVDQDAEALTIIAEITNAGLTSTATRLRNYWDSVLSSIEQPNVILVQILAEDSTGRYVGATSGLAAALETFLDGISVLTAKAHVTDGSINLLALDTSARVKVTEDYNSEEGRQTVSTAVGAEIEAFLLGRDYGSSFRRSDLYRILDAIEGVDWVTVEITNYPTRVDQYGDLEVEDYEVITLGTSPVVEVVLN